MFWTHSRWTYSSEQKRDSCPCEAYILVEEPINNEQNKSTMGFYRTKIYIIRSILAV